MRVAGAALVAMVSLAISIASSSGQNATPTPYWWSTPAICDVPQLSRAELEASQAKVATPVPVVRQVNDVDDLPQGAEAGDEVVALVEATENEYVACFNSWNWPSLLALMTPAARTALLAELLSDVTLDELIASVGTPDTDERGPLVIAEMRVSEVRVLSDGRIGAIVEWRVATDPADSFGEVNFHEYEEVDGVLLLAAEISGFNYVGPGTPTA